MAAKSRWKIEPTSRAKAALTAAQDVLQREQKSAQLTKQEREAWHYLIRTYPERGRAAYAEEIQGNLGWDDAKAAEQAIARLDNMELLRLQGALIACVYPYSVNPTLHEVHFPGMPQWQPVYASSSVDALGISSVIDQEVQVESRCAYCDAAIQIELTGGVLASAKPDTMKIWVAGKPAADGDGHTANAFSEATIFACSDQHLAAWRGREGKRDGYVLTLGEAAFVAKGLYAGLLPAAAAK